MFRIVTSFIRTFSSKQLATDESGLKYFAQMAKDWWNPDGFAKPLHSLNNYRIPLITDRLAQTGNSNSEGNKNLLKGLSILDVGCGGGILTEGLAHTGGDVTGIDVNQTLISVARQHADTKNLPKLQYECTTIEEHALRNKERYDVVVSSETIEHVDRKEDFVKSCVQCLKPGGSIFMTSPNKTWLSRFFIIFILEDVMHDLPKGLHQYDMFIHLDDLRKILKNEKCETIFTGGTIYNPLINKWHYLKNTNFFYFIHSIKNCDFI